MNILRRFSVSAFCIAAMLSAPAAAPQADTSATADSSSSPPAQELERMVVTATKTERAISEVPVSVSVIERADVEVLPAQNIDDLIMHETGVTVKRVVGMAEGIPSDIIIRGVPGAFAASRALILVDGIPTNVSGTPLMILNEIPLLNVGRIEVLRGPFSSLYGANAFSGVVNVFSREAGRVQELAVSHKFWPLLHSDISAWNGGTFTRVDYSIGGGYREIDNYLVSDHALERNGDRTAELPIDNYDYSDGRMLGKVRFWFNDNLSLTIHGRLFGSDLGFGRSQDYLRTDVDIKGRKVLAGPYLDWQPTDNFDLHIGGYARRLTGEFYNTSYHPETGETVPSYWKSVVDDGTAEAQTTVRVGDANTVTAGIDYLENQVAFGATRHRVTEEIIYPGGDERIGNFGVYVQDELRLWDRFVAIPGVRLDYHSLVGTVLSPKIACSYRFAEQLRGRFSFGRAFRAPTLVELYMPQTFLLSGVTMIPSPDLKPEYIVSVDAGTDITIGRRLEATVNCFYNDMRDLISPRIMPDAATLGINIAHRNISEAWSAGVEAALKLRVPLWLEWRLDYAYTESRDVTIELPLDYVPRHTLSAGMVFRRKLGRVLVSGTLTETMVGGRSYLEWQTSDPYSISQGPNDLWLPRTIELPPYWRTDLSLRCAFLKERLWLEAAVQNLFDAEYEESGGTLAPGRFATVTIGGGF